MRRTRRGVVRGMRCVLRAESVTWFPSLGGEDFMAEAIGGFGPFRVVRILGDLARPADLS